VYKEINLEMDAMDGDDEKEEEVEDEEDLQDRKTFKDRCRDYSQQTTIHGWQYVQSESGLLRKIIWAIFIFILLVALIAFVALEFQEYSNATVVNSIDSTTAPLSHITFPSVIICNVNQVSAFKWPILELYNISQISQFFEKFVVFFRIIYSSLLHR
jgi:hypothetical protein